MSGVNLGITVALGKMMILPPYNFNSGAVGLSNIAPLVGTLVAVLAGGVIADWFSMWRTRRNRGIREPEMRLPLVWLSSVIGFAGSLLYGFAIDRELPWISEVVGFGMTSFSIALTSSLILTYAVSGLCAPIIYGKHADSLASTGRLLLYMGASMSVLLAGVQERGLVCPDYGGCELVERSGC